MLKYTLKRLLMMIPALLGITVVSFVVMHLAPGKPTDMMTDLNPQVTLEAKQRLIELTPASYTGLAERLARHV